MPRKPPGMKFETFIEAQIRKAAEEGAFDDLAGKGKPLDLDDASDPLWWAKKFVAREGVSVVPAAIEIRRTVERELAALDDEPRESEVRKRLETLDARIRELNRSVTSGPSTSVPPLDIEALLAGWRERRTR